MFHSDSDLSRRQMMARLAQTTLGVGMLPATSWFTGKVMAEDRPFAAGHGTSPLKQVATARNVIFLYMSGGMSHLDTWDPKPKNAEVMGPTKALNTSADGILVGDSLPRMAKLMHHALVVNSVATNTAAHEQANYFMHTSFGLRSTIKHPGMGAWLSYFQGPGNPALPPYVYVGNDSRHPGAGFFAKKHGPLMVNNPEAGLQNVRPQRGVTDQRFNLRRDIAESMDGEFRQKFQVRDVSAYAEMYDNAVKLMRSEDLEAFDLTKESPETRAAYGKDAFGQGCLLARRLVEHGVRFIEVSLGGWDTHVANFINTPRLGENLDTAMSTLISDLEQRGMLNETLIVLASEFGRTPKINVNQGRDHFPIFSVVLAGGGVKGGTKFGATDEAGAAIAADKVSPVDINASIGYALGLPLNEVVFSPSKRPFTVADKGQPFVQWFS